MDLRHSSWKIAWWSWPWREDASPLFYRYRVQLTLPQLLYKQRLLTQLSSNPITSTTPEILCQSPSSLLVFGCRCLLGLTSRLPIQFCSSYRFQLTYLNMKANHSHFAIFSGIFSRQQFSPCDPSRCVMKVFCVVWILEWPGNKHFLFFSNTFCLFPRRNNIFYLKLIVHSWETLNFSFSKIFYFFQFGIAFLLLLHFNSFYF